jgi:hypothetical protein
VTQFKRAQGTGVAECAVQGDPAPGSAITMFANMKAACQTIAERWPNVPPPKGAIL